MYGADYYSKIGKLGGGTPTDKLKGFAVNRKLAKEVGAVGGRKSTRAKLTPEQATELMGLKLLGWTREELAKEYGIGLSTVDSYIRKGKAHAAASAKYGTQNR